MASAIFEEPGFRVLKQEGRGEGTLVLKLEGSCTSLDFLSNVERIEKIIRGLPESAVVLDVSELDYVNSRFISLLVLLTGSKKRIALHHPSRMLRDLLAVVGIIDWFELILPEGPGTEA